MDKIINFAKIPLMETEKLSSIKHFFLWILGAVACGVVFGTIGSAFARSTLFAVKLRMENPTLLMLLPFGAIIVSFVYKCAGYKEDPGASQVINALNEGEHIRLRMFPLIFFNATLSHLCGASVGRVSSTIQMGGSIGNFVGNKLNLSKKYKNVLIMCGITGVFSALFGTPMAAAFLSLEIATVGIISWYALPFTMITAFIARYIGMKFGIANAHYDVGSLPDTGLKIILIVIILSILTSLLANIYCLFNQYLSSRTKYFIRNPYFRAFLLGSVLLGFTLLTGSQDYNATGAEVVRRAFAGDVVPYAFLLKLLFTFLSLTAGYKGGEVFPALFIGATMGSAFALIFGFPVGLCTAIGLGTMFCGITNCPITSFLLCLELFGGEGAVLYLMAITVNFIISGRCSLYSTQKFNFEKII